MTTDIPPDITISLKTTGPLHLRLVTDRNVASSVIMGEIQRGWEWVLRDSGLEDQVGRGQWDDLEKLRRSGLFTASYDPLTKQTTYVIDIPQGIRIPQIERRYEASE